MLNKAFPERIGTSRKVAVINIILVANAFIWYFYAVNFLKDVIGKMGFADFEALILGINFLGISAAAILGASLSYRFKRRMSFLLYWMLAGVILSLAPMGVNFASSMSYLLIVSAILGFYFGLGMPICMGYYAAATETGNRAKLGGITFLLIGLGFFLLSNIGIQDITLNALILSTWRAVGLVTLVFLKPDEKQIDEKYKVTYSSVVSNKSFLLYLIPWCMFSIVNSMAAPMVGKFFPEDFISHSAIIKNSVIIENILAGISAVVGGFFADALGRKRLAVAGFALLGLGYAVLGLFSGNILGWWFYTAVDGIAWGAFCTIFIITLWGDFAQERSSEKYYAIGSLPFLFSTFIRLSIGTYIAGGIPETAVFSFASLFLFLAVLPLVYAPETLPEKKIRERELKSYIEKAKKAKEKYA